MSAYHRADARKTLASSMSAATAAESSTTLSRGRGVSRRTAHVQPRDGHPSPHTSTRCAALRRRASHATASSMSVLRIAGSAPSTDSVRVSSCTGRRSAPTVTISPDRRETLISHPLYHSDTATSGIGW